MGGRKGAANAVVEGGDGSSGLRREVLGLSNGRGIRCGEEEVEVARTEEIRSVGHIAGGKIRFCEQSHAETPRETTGGVGGIGAPELYVVETFDVETVGFGISPDEVGESDKVEVLVLAMA